jgi:hypothetical protein
MRNVKFLMLRLDGTLALAAFMLSLASAVLANASYNPAPPVPVPVGPQRREARTIEGPHILGFAPGVHVQVAPTPTPWFVGSPSFFPPRPANANIRYRTGVLTDWEVGNKSGWASIRDAAGNKFGYLTGWPVFIDGKQTHCAIAPRPGVQFDPMVCDGGWPADMIIGLTRVRVYYWHDVTPWGQHVEVTDQINKAP